MTTQIIKMGQKVALSLGFIFLVAFTGHSQAVMSIGSGQGAYVNASYSYGENAKEMQRRNDSLSAILVADLEKDHIISAKQNLAFSLNNEEMKVNGEKQPSEVYERYFKKYAPAGAKKSNWNWSYSWSK